MNRRVLETSGWPCTSGAEMREIDSAAIRRFGVPGRLLMESAGRAVALAIRRRFPERRQPLVVCGGGNNGGDGFVVARVLHDWDDRVRPRVAALADRDGYSPEASENLELLESSGVEVTFLERGKELLAAVSRCDLVVDAVFGVGLSRSVEGVHAELLEVLANARSPLVSVDLPSGVSTDTGADLGPPLRPELIVTLGLPKLGLAVRPFAAEIAVADIGLPQAAVDAVPLRQWLWTPSAASARLPARPEAAHKGTFGHVLVVAGSEGKTGAACLAAEGALRSGAGLVTVAAPRALAEVYAVKLTEAMSLPVDDSGLAAFAPASVEALLREAAGRDALVVGPGVGRHPDTAQAVRGLLAAAELPSVVDADGLNAFEGEPEALRCERRVLTPHPGEMARLLGRSTRDVQGDRVTAARELAERSGCTVILKGARSIIASPTGELRINPTGGPALATGGTGDVLAGVVGALLAAGLEALDAAGLAAWLHGAAAAGLGRVGATAGDVAARLPGAWRDLQRAAKLDPDVRDPDERDPDELLLRFP